MLKHLTDDQAPEDPALLGKWQIKEDKALSILKANLSDGQLPHVRSAKSTAQAYRILKSIHDAGGPQQLIFLLNQLFNLRYNEEGGTSLTDFISAAVDLLNQITAMTGGDLSWDKVVALKLLCSLPKSYDPIVMSIGKLDDITPAVVTSLVLRERNRRVDQSATLAKHDTAAVETAFVVVQGARRAVGECPHCHKAGHQESKCWKKYPHLRPQRRSQSSSTGRGGNRDINTSIETGFMAMAITSGSIDSTIATSAYSVNEVIVNGAATNDCTFLLDSACTIGMFGKKDWFYDLKPCQQPVRVGDNSVISAAGRGTIRVKIQFADAPSFLAEFNDVLYVPGIAENLLSVGVLTSNGFSLEFTGEQCIVRASKSGLKLGTVHKRGQVYPVHMEPLIMSMTTRGTTKPPDAAIACGASHITSMLLHQRLGHLNVNSMKELVSKRLVSDYASLPAVTEMIVSHCEGCVLGKSHRHSRPITATNRATHLLQVVHTDIAGPFNTPSRTGAHYFITFIDDLSRFICVYSIARKSDAFACFKQYLAWGELTTGRRLKILRSDNGGEYSSMEFKDFLSKRGIQRQTTAPYTPSQNGVAERFNRTLVESARAMMFHAGLSKQYWADAVKVAAYVRNRVATSAVADGTPFSLFYGKQPDLSNMRVFGCIAYPHIPAERRTKFEAKAVKTIFIGYPAGSKAHILLNLDTNREIVSADVTFWEDRFSGQPVINGSSGGGIPVSFPIDSSDDPLADPVLPVDVVPDVAAPPVDVAPEGAQDRHVEDDNVPAMDDEAVEAKYDNVDAVVIDQDPIPVASPVLIPQPSSAPRPSSPPRAAAKKNSRPALVPLTRAQRAAHQQRWAAAEARGLTAEQFMEEERSRQQALMAVQTETPVRRTYADVVSHPTTAPPTNALSAMEDPLTYAEALARSDSVQWKLAMNSEYSSILRAKTWSLVPLPAGRTAIDSKWVFKTKRLADGSVERLKARLVAKGFTQQQGIDYNETFAPVAKFSSIRALLALAALWDLEVHQMDVKTAFLNGDLEETIYMRQPEGFVQPGKAHMVCKLQKALYGLKQAGRAWYEKIDVALLDYHFMRLESDHCIYVFQSPSVMMFVVLYVDDLVIFSNNLSSLKDFKKHLATLFEMTDLGEAHYVLGIQITRVRSARSLSISQHEYIKTIVDRFGMSESNPCDTPLSISDPFSKADSPVTAADIDAMKAKPYKSAVGSIMYAMLGTRPDIAYAITALSQFNSNPGEKHWKGVKRLLRYLRATIDYKITYGGPQQKAAMIAYCDSDWGQNHDDRRSVTGYVFLLCGAAVSWQAKKQPTVALSTVEAEYMAATEAAREAIWWRSFLAELGLSLPSPSAILSDSQGAIALAKNPAHHSRTKHIDIKHHFVREQVAAGVVVMNHIPTEQMAADILTKPLSRERHLKLASMLLGTPAV